MKNWTIEKIKKEDREDRVIIGNLKVQLFIDYKTISDVE